MRRRRWITENATIEVKLEKCRLGVGRNVLLVKGDTGNRIRTASFQEYKY